MLSIETLKAVHNGPFSSRGRVVCMEQCESAAALLESVREQEVQFEQLTRALEEERRRVGLPATSPSALGRPLPHAQVTLPQKPSDPHPDFQSSACPITPNVWVSSIAPLGGGLHLWAIDSSFMTSLPTPRFHPCPAN